MASRVPERSPSAAGNVPQRPVRPDGRRNNLVTTRAAILVTVIAVLVVSAALPLRAYLSQRAEIGKLQERQALARDRVAALEAERSRLQDPAYVAAEARRRLHFVLPGETAYVLVQPEPQLSATGEVLGGPEAPWYTQLWGSVREADRPAQK